MEKFLANRSSHQNYCNGHPLGTILFLYDTLIAKRCFLFIAQRFIHDIITATLHATGFPKGLFSDKELESGNFKSKEMKVKFLNDLISLVGICEGEDVNVNSAKVVAGLEVLNTNILLAKFGAVALNPEIDREAAIRRCLAGQIPGDEPVPLLTPQVDVDRTTSSTTKHSSMDSEGLISGSVHLPDSQHSSLNGFLGGLSIDASVRLCNYSITQTRDWVIAVGVKKPKCTDKLLQRPPFRFLHDLFMAISHECRVDLQILT